MARPQKVTDTEIFAETRACIARFGVRVPLPLIAERLNVSSALLIKRFGGKDNLIVRSLAPSSSKGLELPRELFSLEPGNARSVLLNLADWFVAVLANAGPSLRAVRAGGLHFDQPFAAVGAPEPAALYADVIAWLRAADRRNLLTCADPETTALSFFGAIYYQTVHAPADTGTIAERTTALFWNMLEPAVDAPDRIHPE